MFELGAAISKLAGKGFVYAVNHIGLATGIDPITIMGGIVIFSGLVTGAYLFGPCIGLLINESASFGIDLANEYSALLDDQIDKFM